MSGDRRSYVIGQTEMTARPLEAALYLVATPIGNLADITLRALETLAAADILACEDTRVSRVLLERYGIRRRATAYHEHNAAEAGPKLIAALKAGQSVALISDAGTPLVSDPGYRLVGEAVERGIKVVPVPGPSAALAALTASGLPSDTFLFAGGEDADDALFDPRSLVSRPASPYPRTRRAELGGRRKPGPLLVPTRRRPRRPSTRASSGSDSR